MNETATRIDLFSLKSVPMRSFYLTCAAAIMLVVAYLYGTPTTDCPNGDDDDLPQERPQTREGGPGGLIAALFGRRNIFARSLGGFISDKFTRNVPVSRRARWPLAVMMAEGIALVLFSRMGHFVVAIATMIVLIITVQIAEGLTCSAVPLNSTRSLVAVSGIVGAGGNVGAVCYAQFLLRSDLPLQDVFFYLGFVVAAFGATGTLVRFNEETEKDAQTVFESSAPLARGAA